MFSYVSPTPSKVQYGSVSPRELGLYGNILAILAVIGGADPRPRVGGVVQHDEFGSGTIAAIRKKQIVVLFEAHKIPKLCPLSQLKSVRVVRCFTLNASVYHPQSPRVLWCKG